MSGALRGLWTMPAGRTVGAQRSTSPAGHATSTSESAAGRGRAAQDSSGGDGEEELLADLQL